MFVLAVIWEVVFAVAATSVGAVTVAQRFFAYDYSQHGQDWAMGACASRTRQSPIDLTAAALAAAAEVTSGAALLTGTASGTFAYKYGTVAAPFELRNNGRTLAADFTAMGYGGITIDDTWYALMSINFHALSEHTWNNEHKALELHLVHKRYDSDALVVIAVPFSVAPHPPALLQRLRKHQEHRALRRQSYAPPPVGEPGFNPALQGFLLVAPPTGACAAPFCRSTTVPTGEALSIQLGDLLLGGTFLEYAGSLTAPPCMEEVQWLVRSEPLTASFTQVQHLASALSGMTSNQGNYRATMPLNGRNIVVRRAVAEASLPLSGAAAGAEAANHGHPQPAVVPRATKTSNPPSGASIEASMEAAEALALATNATDQLAGLDWRLHSIVTATPPPPTPLASGELMRAANEAAARAAERVGQVVTASASAAAEDAANVVAAASQSAQSR